MKHLVTQISGNLGESKVGSVNYSYVIVIPKAVSRIMNIAPGDKISYSLASGNTFVIKPVHNSSTISGNVIKDIVHGTCSITSQ